MLRLGITSLLGTYFQHATFVELNSAESVEADGLKKDFDLIILGVGQEPYSDDIAALEKVKKLCPLSKVIVYDEKPQLELLSQYFRTGLHGYISKQADSAELIECVRQVMDNQKYVGVEIVDLTLRDSASSTSRSANGLDQPEDSVAMSSCSIAETFEGKFSKISTIKFSVLQKMLVSNVTRLRVLFVLVKSRLSTQ